MPGENRKIVAGFKKSAKQQLQVFAPFLQPNYFAGQGQTDIAVAIHEARWRTVHTAVLRNTMQQECNILERVVFSCHNMLGLMWPCPQWFIMDLHWSRFLGQTEGQTETRGSQESTCEKKLLNIVLSPASTNCNAVLAW